MSRIFDALQRSNLEGAGFEFPAVPSLMPEIAQADEVETGEAASDHFQGFQTLPISASTESRLVSMTDQASLGAEKFRFLAVRLRQLQLTRPLKKILITSTTPEEGKSMISANLALSLAQRRSQKVLLVEGDLRRPSLCARFGLRSLPGLSEWLQGDLGPIRNIYHLEDAGFWFMPAGSPPEHNMELVQPERLSKLMGQVEAQFDWILIDSSPIVPLADTSVWMRSADGILLVVREGTTQKRQLRRGLKLLETSSLLGVVLNGSTNTDHEHYYERYGRPHGTTSDRRDMTPVVDRHSSRNSS